MKTILALTMILAVMVCSLFAQSAPDGKKDPFPAAMDTFQIPSHGVGLNALMYIAKGGAPHPAVILLHGFPGNERNLDLAQAMRREGWNVLYFNYRGSWGTKGDYSMTHGIEDVASAVEYLRSGDNAKRLRVDPKRIVIIGHSMGGFFTVQAAAADPQILAAGLISAADNGSFVPDPMPANGAEAFVRRLGAGLENEGMAPLAGATGESLAREVLKNAADWRFASKVQALRTRPVLILTSDDGLAGSGTNFADALTKAGNTRVSRQHFATDHSYSDQRLQLIDTVLKWLATLK